MFQKQGPDRSTRHNCLVAGYLAAIAGFVNSGGFLLIGSFTSHVTGNVGRVANDVVASEFHAAAAAVTMVIAFFLGTFAASMTIESDAFRRAPNAYGFALASEGALLLGFTVLTRLAKADHPRARDAEALILCAAMGMQNSLVTRLSGAVARTTHLTGVITDLGIEAARWFRYWRSTLSERVNVRLSIGRPSPTQPSAAKVVLLATIACTFVAGAIAGASAVGRFGHAAMLIPAVAVLACSTYAFMNGRVADRDDRP